MGKHLGKVFRIVLKNDKVVFGKVVGKYLFAFYHIPRLSEDHLLLSLENESHCFIYTFMQQFSNTVSGKKSLKFRYQKRKRALFINFSGRTFQILIFAGILTRSLEKKLRFCQ